MTGGISPELLLAAYASGVFPMAESADDPQIRWVDPSRRGIIPVNGFHISRSLKKAILRGDYKVTLDKDFQGVLSACANREDTWINREIFSLYIELFNMGFAHSQEIWDGGDLVGGVYGVALGRAFFGESMFSRRTNGSKIALAYLLDRLRRTGFVLFDTQFLTDHLASLGAIEISRRQYHERLELALQSRADIFALPEPQSPVSVTQRSGQTS